MIVSVTDEGACVERFSVADNEKPLSVLVSVHHELAGDTCTFHDSWFVCTVKFGVTVIPPEYAVSPSAENTIAVCRRD